MRDERLRRAARHAARTADPVERAAWLVERLRAGQLRPELLELAAGCGDEVAGLALGAPVELLCAAELVEAVLVRAPRLAPRLAVAVFRRVARAKFGHERPHEEAAAAAEECLRRPTARTAQAAVAAADRVTSRPLLLRRHVSDSYEWWPPEDEVRECLAVFGLATYAARAAAHLALARRYGPPDPEPLRGLVEHRDALPGPDGAPLLELLRETVVTLALA